MHIYHTIVLFIEVLKIENFESLFYAWYFQNKSSQRPLCNSNDTSETTGSIIYQIKPSLVPIAYDHCDHKYEMNFPMKSAEILDSLKNMIKKWDSPNCKYSACKYVPGN